MNREFIEQKIKEMFGTQASFAEKLGVTPPSLNDWLKRKVIPAARISDVFRLLGITSKEEKDIALGLPTLKFSFRAKKDLKQSEVPADSLKNVTKFSNAYFNISNLIDSKNDLEAIRSEIADNREYKEVASIIRKHLEISDYIPFDNGPLDYTLQKFGIHVYLIPFGGFGFNSNGERLRALTANLNKQYLVLCDSSRTHDEAMFDLTHELVHIFTGLVGGDPNSEIEDFIDMVSEELIYPEKFLTREFPFLLEKGKRITSDHFLRAGFRDLMQSFGFFAPRGVAKTLSHLGYIKENHNVYSWMYDQEHDFYLKYFGKSISKMGKMDFDFTDTYEFQSFIENIVLTDIKKYPLFFSIVKALTIGKITTRAFAEIFDMDAGDVDELKKELETKLAYLS